MPVLNVDDKLCRWKDVKGVLTVEKFNEGVELGTGDEQTLVIAAIGALEPEWLNSPMESFDHLLD